IPPPRRVSEPMTAKHLERDTAVETADTPSFKRELLATLPSLRAFAVSLSGKHDKADDLVQDTVMKAWAKQSSFEMGTNLKAWLLPEVEAADELPGTAHDSTAAP